MRNELPSRREVIRAAWFEYKVTKAVADLATEPMLAAERPPRAFVDIELGFGFAEGPSLMATLDDVSRASAHGYRLRGDRTRERVTQTRPKQRASANDRRARLQAMLEAAENAA
jgi:hypothetical protein